MHGRHLPCRAHVVCFARESRVGFGVAGRCRSHVHVHAHVCEPGDAFDQTWPSARLHHTAPQGNSEVRGNCGPSAKGFGRPRSTWPDWVRSAAPLQSPRGGAPPALRVATQGFRFSGASRSQANTPFDCRAEDRVASRAWQPHRNLFWSLCRCSSSPPHPTTPVAAASRQPQASEQCPGVRVFPEFAGRSNSASSPRLSRTCARLRALPSGRRHMGAGFSPTW